MDCELAPLAGPSRANCARRVRRRAAQAEHPPKVPVPQHPCTADEDDPALANYAGSFTKGLRHDALGEVIPAAYQALLGALASGDPAHFEALAPQLGCPDDGCNPEAGPQRKLENPQAGYAFDLQGVDPHQAGPLADDGCVPDPFPPPPSFKSATEIGEMAELYWMALARDVPFTDYPADPLIAAAVADLNAFALFEGLTPWSLFRGSATDDFDHPAPPDLVGPYVSQFLLLDAPYGAQMIPARIRTVLPNVDYLTVYEDWLKVQNGCDADQVACDPTPRFIRNGRDLGQYVHVDTVFQAFFNAALILQMGRETRRCEAAPGLGTPYAAGLPYGNPMAPRLEDPAIFPADYPPGAPPPVPPAPPPGLGKSATQIGIATFGPQHVETLVVEVTTRALKAAWYQKWQVHRRLRPEEFGGRVHNHVLRQVAPPKGKAYPFDLGEFDNLTHLSPATRANPPAPTSVLGRIFAHNRLQNTNRRRSLCVPASNLPANPAPNEPTWLLPLAFAEGSPLHPSYAAGHATVSGACATILKALFAEDQLIANPVVPNRAGTALVAYNGPDADRITVGGELDKLASNVSLGRNFAGVHWRSDHRESIRLGEAVAVRLLIDQAFTCNEDFALRFIRFDGTPLTIAKTSSVGAGGAKTSTVTCDGVAVAGPSVVGTVVC